MQHHGGVPPRPLPRRLLRDEARAGPGPEEGVPLPGGGPRIQEGDGGDVRQDAGIRRHKATLYIPARAAGR